MLNIMRGMLPVAVILVAGSIASSSSVHAQALQGDYRLHAGDKIQVSVWKEEKMERMVTIRPDGKFSFPLSGEVQAAGRTADEVRTEIESRLKKFIPEPVVTVTVEDATGNRIFVIGQVKQAGVFVMNPQVDILQAITLAGGPTPFAKLDDIIVIRRTGATQTSLPFQYSQVTAGKALAQNIFLESGDVVVVP